MVYAVSDLHGDLIMYNHIVNQLKEDDTLYIVGDIIDRGNSGIAILQDVMKRPNVELLLGNREWFLIMSMVYNDEHTMNVWLSNRNGVAHKREVSFEQVKEIANAFYNLTPYNEGSFKFFKDVFSSAVGKSPCIILYTLKDDFPVADLLYAPHLLVSIDDTTYGHNFTNCSEEKFEYGKKVIFTYTEENINYKKGKDNIFLQYTEFKEKYGE